MTKPPRLSILLPTFNGAKFLGPQLTSISAQSFGDFELLALDDGSTDGTVELLQAQARMDQRVRIVKSDGNRGQKHRLAELVGLARAPLVSISDQDDLWEPQRTERLVSGLCNNAAAYGRSELIDGSGVALGRNVIECFGPAPAHGDRLMLLFVGRVSGHCMVARREVVSEMAFRRFQPFDWLISLDALFSGGLTYVDDAVVYHRLHGGNQSNGPLASSTSLRQRVRPAAVYVELQSIRRRRADFVQRVEHLAHSPVIPPRIAALFHDVARRCREAWFQPGTGRPFTDSKLRVFLRRSLAPLAGSERDWEIATEHLASLTRSQFHPRNLVASARHVLGPTHIREEGPPSLGSRWRLPT